MRSEGDETTSDAGENILSWARAILETTPVRWTQLTQTAPEELLARVPVPGEWSAVECLRHLLDVERNVFPPRVRAILAGQDFPAFDPAGREGEAGLTAQQLAAAFAQAREVGLAALSQVSEDDLDRTGRHSQLGVMSLRELLHAWAAHDLNHTVQAERAAMQPFIAGSGALAFRFADHVAKGSGS
ncbi:MAG TPA: DinB family protein [Ktedonobacterales bacterium]